jgi:hypothetical protein
LRQKLTNPPRCQDEEAFLEVVARDAKAQRTSAPSGKRSRAEVPFPHPPPGVGAPLALAALPPRPLAAPGDPFARVAAAHKAAVRGHADSGGAAE